MGYQNPLAKTPVLVRVNDKPLAIKCRLGQEHSNTYAPFYRIANYTILLWASLFHCSTSKLLYSIERIHCRVKLFHPATLGFLYSSQMKQYSPEMHQFSFQELHYRAIMKRFNTVMKRFSSVILPYSTVMKHFRTVLFHFRTGLFHHFPIVKQWRPLSECFRMPIYPFQFRIIQFRVPIP